MLHVDQFAVSDEACAVVGAIFCVVPRIELFCEAEQTWEEVRAEQLQFAHRQIGEVVKIVMKEGRRREPIASAGATYLKRKWPNGKGWSSTPRTTTFGDLAMNSSSRIAH